MSITDPLAEDLLKFLENLDDKPSDTVLEFLRTGDSELLAQIITKEHEGSAEPIIFEPRIPRSGTSNEEEKK